jgi:OmpA-OmpF porin, OOP family
MRRRALAISCAGLATLALLYAIAMPRLVERVPETLRELAAARLQAQGLAWVQVRAEGRDLHLRGAAPSRAEQRGAVTLAGGVPGVRHVADAIRLREVSPYRLSIAWQDGRLAVAGYMPDQARLDAVAARIAPHAGTGAAGLAVAAGHPPGWSALATAVVDAITGLDQGSAELIDRALSLRGTATSVNARDRVLAALSAFEGRGFALDADISLIVSPYTMTLTQQDGKLDVYGFVPDPASRRRLTEHLTGHAAETDATAAVELHVAAGAPGGWLDLVRVILDALPGFEHADAALSDRHLRLAGTLFSSAEQDRLIETLRAFEPQGYGLDLALAAADEAAVRCQARLDQLLLTPILFASGAARIDERSDALLAALADTLTTCPGARIRIAGHTDDRGRPEDNLLLSRKRAEAVAARLMDAGVEAARITAVGHGAERPVADNATAAGRAKNRRIAFNVEVDR